MNDGLKDELTTDRYQKEDLLYPKEEAKTSMISNLQHSAPNR